MTRLRRLSVLGSVLAGLVGPASEAFAGDEPGYFDVDLGFQTRAFADPGLQGQSQDQPSASIKFSFSRVWDESAQAITVTPFYRYDSKDDERTHADLRELFWTRIGEDWEFHLGARQIFWGVTEFKHLVDVINQTDLVEDIDGEDKLGQPMAHLSLVRGGGILDLFLMTGFRERTFPGEEGRLRPPIAIDPDRARYESDDRERHVDVAVRWSQDVGALSYGIYHFAGTSRDPLFDPVLGANNEVTLVPYYPQIDQTGLDAQLVAGDWAFKLEAISRAGFGERYEAFNAGFERTLVSVLGTRSDLGLVVEYLHDGRGDEAFDTLFERDLALGTRVSFNDMADTQALAGFIVDQETKEHVLSLEATRRLGDSWTVALEGRLFGGADSVDPKLPAPMLLSPEIERSAPLQRDDYVQLEFTRFF
ncbi:MAG: hypothetical protein ACO377_04240 [Pseudomonadales bacterium]